MGDRLSVLSSLTTLHSGLGRSGARKQVAEQRTGSGHLKSRVIKRSVVVGGHKTSVSLEDLFWNALRDIARERGVHLSQLVGDIDQERKHGNLSSAIRLFVFEHRRNHAPDGHGKTEPRPDGPDSSPYRQARATE